MATIFLRPLVGGWVDRHGVRAPLLLGAGVLGAVSFLFQLAGTPGAVIGLILGLAMLLAGERRRSGLRRSPAATPGV